MSAHDNFPAYLRTLYDQFHGEAAYAPRREAENAAQREARIAADNLARAETLSRQIRLNIEANLVSAAKRGQGATVRYVLGGPEASFKNLPPETYVRWAIEDAVGRLGDKGIDAYAYDRVETDDEDNPTGRTFPAIAAEWVP